MHLAQGGGGGAYMGTGSKGVKRTESFPHTVLTSVKIVLPTCENELPSC